MESRTIEHPGPWKHPLRDWEDTGDHRAMLVLTLSAAGDDAEAALRRAAGGVALRDSDLAVLGIANSHAYLSTLVPVALLMQRDRVRVHPQVEAMLRGSGTREL